MPENEFEKQVQQKLEELKLNPSGEVWTNVEAKIGKEKKRRTGLLFFLLFLFISSAAIFWWKQTPQQNTFLVKNNLTDTIINKEKEIIAVKSVSEKNNVTQKQLIVLNDTYNKSKTAGIFITTIKSSAAQSQADAVIYNTNKIRSQSGSKMNVTVTTAIGSDVQDNNLNANKPLIDSADNTTTLIDTIENTATKTITNTVDSNKKLITETKKDTEATTKKLIVAEIKTAKNKWKFAVSVGLGMSATDNVGIGKSNADLSSLPTPTGPSINNGFGQSYASLPIKQSWAFKIGVSAMYPVSKRVTFTAGVTYKLYSTVIGKANDDSSFQNTFGTENGYHNYYHFIDIPVELQYRIGNSKKPVYAFGGISFSELIYTNSLQYNITDGAYYKDNALFYKPGIGITAGILFDLFLTQKIPLQVGPDLYYGLSNMARSGLYNNSHYSYIGIRLQKIIGKN